MGMHRAAATLRQMVREQVLLSIPTATIIPREIAARFVQENSKPQLVAVQQSFDGSFSGQALLIFPQTRSLEIVRSILGDKHSFDDIVTMEHEVLAEAGNIILNPFLALSQTSWVKPLGCRCLQSYEGRRGAVCR
jgi:chemotaxis protein CheC